MALDTVKMLQNAASVNVFDEVEIVKILGNSDTVDIYFRLWQTDRDERYIPATGATMTVTFPRALTVDANTPANQDITKTATNPFSDDRSIWKVTLDGTADPDEVDTVTGNSFQVSLTESGSTTVLWITQAIRKLVPEDRGC